MTLSLQDYGQRIFRLLAVEVPAALQGSLRLFEDLDLDSLQAFELVVATEQLAGRDVPPPELPAIWTLGDAYNYYLDSVAAAEAAV